MKNARTYSRRSVKEEGGRWDIVWKWIDDGAWAGAGD